MPIYEYECKNCSMTLEELQSFSDPPLKKCPNCKKNKLEKLISLSSFQLTGTGWYTTDYAKGPGIPPQAKDQDNPAVETSSDSTASDSKATVAESGPSSAEQAVKSIEKETKKAKSEAKK